MSLHQPFLVTFALNNKTFTQISINNCLSHGQPGDPSLPLYPIKILIPQGKKVKDISIVDSHSQDIDYSFLEKPVFPEQNPISQK